MKSEVFAVLSSFINDCLNVEKVTLAEFTEGLKALEGDSLGEQKQTEPLQYLLPDKNDFETSALGSPTWRYSVFKKYCAGKPFKEKLQLFLNHAADITNLYFSDKPEFNKTLIKELLELAPHHECQKNKDDSAARAAVLQKYLSGELVGFKEGVNDPVINSSLFTGALSLPKYIYLDLGQFLLGAKSWIHNNGIHAAVLLRLVKDKINSPKKFKDVLQVPGALALLEECFGRPFQYNAITIHESARIFGITLARFLELRRQFGILQDIRTVIFKDYQYAFLSKIDFSIWDINKVNPAALKRLQHFFNLYEHNCLTETDAIFFWRNDSYVNPFLKQHAVSKDEKQEAGAAASMVQEENDSLADYLPLQMACARMLAICSVGRLKEELETELDITIKPEKQDKSYDMYYRADQQLKFILKYPEKQKELGLTKAMECFSLVEFQKIVRDEFDLFSVTGEKNLSSKEGYRQRAKIVYVRAKAESKKSEEVLTSECELLFTQFFAEFERICQSWETFTPQVRFQHLKNKFSYRVTHPEIAENAWLSKQLLLGKLKIEQLRGGHEWLSKKLKLLASKKFQDYIESGALSYSDFFEFPHLENIKELENLSANDFKLAVLYSYILGSHKSDEWVFTLKRILGIPIGYGWEQVRKLTVDFECLRKFPEPLKEFLVSTEVQAYYRYQQDARADLANALNHIFESAENVLKGKDNFEAESLLFKIILFVAETKSLQDAKCRKLRAQGSNVEWLFIDAEIKKLKELARLHPPAIKAMHDKFAADISRHLGESIRASNKVLLNLREQIITFCDKLLEVFKKIPAEKTASLQPAAYDRIWEHSHQLLIIAQTHELTEVLGLPEVDFKRVMLAANASPFCSLSELIFIGEMIDNYVISYSDLSTNDGYEKCKKIAALVKGVGYKNKNFHKEESRVSAARELVIVFFQDLISLEDARYYFHHDEFMSPLLKEEKEEKHNSERVTLVDYQPVQLAIFNAIYKPENSAKRNRLLEVAAQSFFLSYSVRKGQSFFETFKRYSLGAKEVANLYRAIAALDNDNKQHLLNYIDELNSQQPQEQKIVNVERVDQYCLSEASRIIWMVFKLNVQYLPKLLKELISEFFLWSKESSTKSPREQFERVRNIYFHDNITPELVKKYGKDLFSGRLTPKQAIGLEAAFPGNQFQAPLDSEVILSAYLNVAIPLAAEYFVLGFQSNPESPKVENDRVLLTAKSAAYLRPDLKGYLLQRHVLTVLAQNDAGYVRAILEDAYQIIKGMMSLADGYERFRLQSSCNLNYPECAAKTYEFKKTASIRLWHDLQSAITREEVREAEVLHAITYLTENNSEPKKELLSDVQFVKIAKFIPTVFMTFGRIFMRDAGDEGRNNNEIVDLFCKITLSLGVIRAFNDQQKRSFCDVLRRFKFKEIDEAKALAAIQNIHALAAQAPAQQAAVPPQVAQQPLEKSCRIM